MGAETKLSVKIYDFFNVFSRNLMLFQCQRIIKKWYFWFCNLKKTYIAQNGPHSVKKCHNLQAFKVKLSLPQIERSDKDLIQINENGNGPLISQFI